VFNVGGLLYAKFLEWSVKLESLNFEPGTRNSEL
jgi:hypothetical protein